MRTNILFLACLFTLASTGKLCAVTNVFEYPLVFRKHQQLTGEFQRAMQARNFAEMEHICRTGVALLPENPVWRYDLGCALALQSRSTEAFETLTKAVDLGFRDDRQIAQDRDLTNLRTLPGFQALLSQARNLRGKPVDGQPVLTPAPILDGTVHINASNTTWDFEMGHFRTFFVIPTNPPAPASFAAQWNGPAATQIRPWLTANNAAGNSGDFYDNRDDGHSRLDCTPFPGLTPTTYDADARSHNAHYGLNTFLYNGVVLGNSSVAITTGPLWRSVPRGALTEGPTAAFLFAQYLHNQLYFYPAHHDHDASGLGDLYPVNQPYVLISQGSSGSDQPFLQAAAATLAAFRPETKQLLISRNLIVPTLQMLLRASQKNVVNPEDYLTGSAHPTVFDAANLDVDRMVRMAHDLATNNIPPIVALRTVQEQRALPGVDFFDTVNSEALYDSPCVISRILRSMAHRHTMTVSAQLIGMPADGWKLHWVVLRGDTRKTSILPLKPDQSEVELSVTYHGGRFPAHPGQPLQTSRVDIGVFASNGTLYSAPSFISFFHLNNEIRTYSDDGRILSVDYNVATNRYVDPVISRTKAWRDDYQYDTDHQLTGWTRHQGDRIEQFNPRGERIEATDKLGRPTTTRAVQYIPRSFANNASVPELIEIDSDTRIHYRYKSDHDLTGEVSSREKVNSEQ